MDEEIELGAEEARAANGRAPGASAAPRPPAPSVHAVPNQVSSPVRSASGDDRVAKLETELADWQRRAVLWRERALNVQALNEVLTQNLDDLRAVLRLTTPPEEGDDQPRQLQPRPKSGFEQWWSRVFSRENWTTER